MSRGICYKFPCSGAITAWPSSARSCTARAKREGKNSLKKVHDALAPGGTVAIAEFIPDEGRCGPPMPLIFAINMLVNTEEGDTFTYSEMSSWLKEAEVSATSGN